MAAVKLADVIVPDVYASYQAENGPEKTAFWESGVISNDELLNAKANTGGDKIQIPFWKDLDADSEPNYSDTSDVNATPDKVSAAQMDARISYLNNGWSAKDLAGELAGSSPNQRIAQRTGRYWQIQQQRRLIAMTEGILAGNIANNDGDMVFAPAIEDGAAADASNLIGRSAVVEACFTLGDGFDSVGIIAMHSAVYKRLVNLEDIDFIKDSTGTLSIPTYLGRRVAVDDGMTAVAGSTSGIKYTTILFGAGAFGVGVGSPEVPLELDRDPKTGRGGGESTIWERNTWLMHPAGFDFTSATVAADTGPDGGSATLAELRLAANWARKYDRKNIPLAFLVTNG